MAAISQTTFSNTFFVNKNFVFWLIFHLSCPEGSSYQYVSIGSDNGLATNRRQAIIWTNAEPVRRRENAGHNGEMS